MLEPKYKEFKKKFSQKLLDNLSTQKIALNYILENRYIGNMTQKSLISVLFHWLPNIFVWYSQENGNEEF